MAWPLQDQKKRGEEWGGPDYLAMVVPPVLNSLVDADARVRYYACEALYNIAKVGRHHARTAQPCQGGWYGALQTDHPPPLFCSVHAKGSCTCRASQVSRDDFLEPHFNCTFDALFRLVADPDPAVHQATTFLDALMKVRCAVPPLPPAPARIWTTERACMMQ